MKRQKRPSKAEVEAVARAMHQFEYPNGEPVWRSPTELARVAILAMLALDAARKPKRKA